MAAVPATATDLYMQPTAGLSALLVIDTMVVPGLSRLNTSSGGGGGGGGGGGTARGGSHAGVHAGAAGAGAAGAGAAGGGGATGGGSGSQKSVAMSEKLADHGLLVPVVRPGAVPGSPGPDTTIPAPAINAAAAMRMPGRRYHGEAASVSSAVRVAFASPEPSAIPIECADSAPP